MDVHGTILLSPLENKEEVSVHKIAVGDVR